MSQYLTYCSSTPDTSVNAMASTQKEESAIVAQACFFVLLFLRVAWFACRVWMSTVRDVVRVLHVRSAKIKTTKLFSEWPVLNFCAIEIFPL